MTKYRIVTHNYYGIARRYLQFEYQWTEQRCKWSWRWPFLNRYTHTVTEWRYIPGSHFQSVFTQKGCTYGFDPLFGTPPSGVQSSYTFSERDLVNFTKLYPDIDVYLDKLRGESREHYAHCSQELATPTKYL